MVVGSGLLPGLILRMGSWMVRGVKRFEALGLLTQLALGNHLGHPAVKLYHAVEVRIDSCGPLTAMADGEEIATVPLTVNVRPGVLRAVCPEPVEGASTAKSFPL